MGFNKVPQQINLLMQIAKDNVVNQLTRGNELRLLVDANIFGILDRNNNSNIGGSIVEINTSIARNTTYWFV